MSDQEQGKQINPSRLIFGRIVVTDSMRRAKVNARRGEKVEVGGRIVKAVPYFSVIYLIFLLKKKKESHQIDL